MAADIKGKVAVVTGGATGMGRAAALEFGRLGAKVAVVTGSNVAGGQETVRMIEAEGGEAAFFQCNITKEADVAAMIAAVVEKWGRIDCAFNNAGIGPDGKRIPFAPLVDFSVTDFDDILAVNLRGVFLCLKYEMAQMIKQGHGGSIVNTSSVGGLRMVPGFGAYGPSKAGINAITQTAALEGGHDGIRVNVVCPGPTLGTVLMDNNIGSQPDPKAFEADMSAHVPLGKLGTTEDIANTVVWLLSDMAGHVTGETIAVCGGMQI